MIAWAGHWLHWWREKARSLFSVSLWILRSLNQIIVPSRSPSRPPSPAVHARITRDGAASAQAAAWAGGVSHTSVFIAVRIRLSESTTLCMAMAVAWICVGL
jgi:hypothetical protein